MSEEVIMFTCSACLTYEQSKLLQMNLGIIYITNKSQSNLLDAELNLFTGTSTNLYHSNLMQLAISL